MTVVLQAWPRADDVSAIRHRLPACSGTTEWRGICPAISLLVLWLVGRIGSVPAMNWSRG